MTEMTFGGSKAHLYLGDQFLQNWSVKAKQI